VGKETESAKSKPGSSSDHIKKKKDSKIETEKHCKGKKSTTVTTVKTEEPIQREPIRKDLKNTKTAGPPAAGCKKSKDLERVLVPAMRG
jgi:hypothetical protein